MKKTLLFLPLFLFFQNCQQEAEPIVADRFDEQFLYKRWEYVTSDPTTGIETYKPFSYSYFSYEFVESGQAIYYSLMPVCGTDGCIYPMPQTQIGTLDFDHNLGLLKINITNTHARDWEIVALSDSELKVLEK